MHGPADSARRPAFLRGCFRDLPSEAAALYEMVTGWATGGDDLRAAGERIVNLKRLFNLREGWTRADDGLPARLRRPDDGLDELVGAYYAVRGWRPDGTVPADHVARLELDELL